MNTQLASPVSLAHARSSTRAHIVSLLGPTTVAAGAVWAILQPYRLTLLHPRGEGLWWLLLEPPLLVALAGILFAALVARPLLSDLEAHERRESRAASR